MTDYILVPVEPTEKMLNAGLDLGNVEVSEVVWIYEAMLAAAPAVQGEPVGYVSPRLLDALRSGKACGITLEDKPDAHSGVTIPLYTALQPAEQQPAPDVSALVDALEDINQWVNRWVSADHPVAKAARKALAAYNKQEGES